MSEAPAIPQRFGLIFDEPIEAYHNTDATSHSKLEVLRDPDRGPARYLGQFILRNIPRQGPTEAVDLGQAFDSLLLEGKEVHIQEPETYMGPESQKKDAPLIAKPWNNNATVCREWQAQHQDKIVLTAGQIRLLEAMRVAVQNNPDAAALLIPGRAQVTFRARFRWFSVQVRPDKWHPNGVTLSRSTIAGSVLADLKTAEDMDQFEQNRRNFGYDRQAALYRRVVREVLADIAGVPVNEVDPPDFFFVVVFKTAPVDSIVFRLSDEDMEAADAEVMEDLRYLHRCYEAGEWPGSLRGIQTLPKLWRKETKYLF